jgi:hypothetical protein
MKNRWAHKRENGEMNDCIYIDDHLNVRRAHVMSEPVKGKHGWVICVRLDGEKSGKFRPLIRVHVCPWCGDMGNVIRTA